ncbi:MAG: aspartyl/asparaginyl beta-hydroxylase domain-containing protein [Proteobacteria bacterium]|nr:aspartyl/asparaginyl beta-hydroxylase domain-containing protein [Pseudomonadota bacterium]
MDSEADIDRVLADNPQDVRALVGKADLRSLAGDDRIAVRFYKAALRAAAASMPLSRSLRPAIERAQAQLAQASAAFERQLENTLAHAGFPAEARPARFQHSIDILTGRRQARIELQRPGGYFYPDLPQRRYYERSELPWTRTVEAATDVIRDEILGWLHSGEDHFSPYMASDPMRPRQDAHGLTDNPEWSTLYLWQNGKPVGEHICHCPRTFEIISRLDVPHITTRAPAILFSRLSPGARIPPHTGFLNTRLICHLPLVVPPDCGFRVGGETRRWVEGELLVFDDTVEHEAWNDSDQDRILLIFDVWRPELDETERKAIVALFEAVDDYVA